MEIGEGSTSRQRKHSPTLLQAALEGSVEILDSLIEQDPLILLKASLTSLSGKPLHVSSLRGHLHFTRAILNRDPELASDLDTYKRSPLHLASAEGHAEIVEALLQKNDSTCLDRDEDGRIPLHLAAMRGQTDVIRELIRAKPDSIYMELNGDTALHLCVWYNHLDTLKILVEMINDDELVNKGNRDGNTILHLATPLQHVKILKYLISVPKVKAGMAVSVNRLGFTAFDVLEHGPRNLKTMEIRRILKEASPVWARNIAKRWLKKLKHFLDYKGKWLEELGGVVMLVATVIATISFQVITNPPGGVLQANYTDKDIDYLSIFVKCINNPDQTEQCKLPGQAVLGYVFPDTYNQLVLSNTVAFVASVSIILMIITGFSLKNKLFMWFSTLAMGIAVISLAVNYIFSLLMISPYGAFSIGGFLTITMLCSLTTCKGF